MKTSETTTPADGVSTADDGAHLDGFVIPENDEAFVDPDAPQELGEDGEPVDPHFEPERLDKAAFFITFKMIFDVPQMLDPDFQPLAIEASERDQARVASDAAYDLLEIWYPAALSPNSETMAHLMVLVPFLLGKFMIARSILQAKRATIEHGPALAPVPADKDEEPKGAI